MSYGKHFKVLVRVKNRHAKCISTPPCFPPFSQRETTLVLDTKLSENNSVFNLYVTGKRNEMFGKVSVRFSVTKKLYSLTEITSQTD